MSTVVIRGGLSNLSLGNTVNIPTTFPNVVGGHNTAFNFKVYTWTTRTSISASSNSEPWAVTYNKISPSSTIYCRAYIRTGGVVNGQVGWYVRYGSSARSYKGNAYAEWQGAFKEGQTSSNTNNHGMHQLHSMVAGVTTTGNQTFTIGWAARDGGANAPGVVFNPSTSDDARSRNPGGAGSILYLWEVEN